jgi:hypothetical protein
MDYFKMEIRCDDVISSGSRESGLAFNASKAHTLSRLPLEMTDTPLLQLRPQPGLNPNGYRNGWGCATNKRCAFRKIRILTLFAF